MGFTVPIMAGTPRPKPVALIRLEDGTPITGEVLKAYMRINLLYKYQPEGFIKLAREIFIELCREDKIL